MSAVRELLVCGLRGWKSVISVWVGLREGCAPRLILGLLAYGYFLCVSSHCIPPCVSVSKCPSFKEDTGHTELGTH